VQGAAKKTIADYQLSALLMAIRLKGMTDEETRDLTLSMAASGDQADLSGVGRPCVDKHSTGGVGDTTTLILAPLVAACGGYVAKISGRGLGHTGGTLDKLESIPGMSVNIPMEKFVSQVRETGCAVIGQTGEFAPADKTLYALRDVTATVDSLPLIVSSIMSKKLAAGSDAIVLDVKTGSGAIMRTLEESLELAEKMVQIGELAGRKVAAVVSGMDQPLGTHIGNALEVKEAIDVLSLRTGGRLLNVSMLLAGLMLVLSGVCENEDEAQKKLQQALESGRGLEKLEEMIARQGGNPQVCRNTDLLPKAQWVLPVISEKEGYLVRMDTALIGRAAMALGAGRQKKEDDVDPAVGVVMNVSLGEKIQKGQILAWLHENGRGAEEAMAQIRQALVLEEEPSAVPPLVYALVRDGKTERLC